MALISFCGLLTLQVGAAILGVIFMCIAGCMFSANFFDYHNSIEDGWFPFSLVIMITFAIGMIIAGVLMFGSSYTENRTLALLALVMVIVLICFWLILCCFSFLSYREHVDGICIDHRCPETFWIGNLRYRRYHVPPEWLEEEEAKKTKNPTAATKSAKLIDADSEADSVRPEDNSTDRRKRHMEHTTESTFKDGMFHIDHVSEFVDDPEHQLKGPNTSDDTYKDPRISLIDPKFKNISIENGTLQGIEEQESGKHPKTSNKTKISYNQTVTKPMTFPEVKRGQENHHGENGTDDSNRTRTNRLSFKTFNHFRFRREAETVTPTPSSASNTTEESRYYFGVPFMGAIILFIINLLFLLFSALVMYSWAQELAWVDYIYDGPRVVVVEDY